MDTMLLQLLIWCLWMLQLPEQALSYGSEMQQQTHQLRSTNITSSTLVNTNASISTRNLKKNSAGGNLPSIFIVGVQKGGSSSLFELLVEHPLMCGGTHKESHCFDKLDNYNQGIQYYESLYLDKKCEKHPDDSKYVDGTPMLHNSIVWERIYQRYSDFPEVRDSLKFIALLREPVARDYSWYEHAIRYNLHLGLRFDEIQSIAELYTGSKSDHRKGLYYDQLEAFVKFFRRDQMLVLSSAAIFQNTQSTVERIRQFINMPKDVSLTKSFPHDQHLHQLEKLGIADCVVSHVPKFDCSVRDRMGEYYEPLNKKLYEWLETSKPQAHPSEPPFWPLFDSYKNIPCVDNAREEYDLVLEADNKAGKTQCVVNNDLLPDHLYQPI